MNLNKFTEKSMELLNDSQTIVLQEEHQSITAKVPKVSGVGINVYTDKELAVVLAKSERVAKEWRDQFVAADALLFTLARERSIAQKILKSNGLMIVVLEEIIMAERSGENPLQAFVDAICYAAPMEEITRIKFGAVSQPKAVDSSPSRRLDVALGNLAKGAQQGTSKSKRTLTQCIINELTKASVGDVTSFAVEKKEEVQRIAASAR